MTRSNIRITLSRHKCMKIHFVAIVFLVVHVFCLLVVLNTSVSMQTFQKRLLDFEKQNVAASAVIRAKIEENVGKINSIATESDINSKILYELMGPDETDITNSDVTANTPHLSDNT